MTRKRVAWLVSLVSLGIVVIFVVSGILYVQRTYFFNPITFRNNDVLYLPWKWYKKPMDMQIYTVMTPPTKLVTISDPNQVKYVFSELEKGSLQKATPFNQMESLPKDPTYNILIRAKDNEEVQMVNLYPQEKLAEIWTQHGNVGESEFISLTPSLFAYVKGNLGE